MAKIFFTLDEEEAKEVVEILHDEANEAYEIACGNWGTPINMQHEKELYDRHDKLTAIAKRISEALNK